MAAAARAPLVVNALTPKATAAVVLLHGLGDSGDGWLDVAQMLNQALPHVKWILPHAPTIPVTLNSGYRMPAWFDIIALNRDARQDERGIKQSVAYAKELINAEVKSGIPAARIVLAGFSQGAAMSLYTALTTDVQLAGVLSMSGFLLLGEQLEKAKGQLHNVNTPFLMCHGDRDPVVQYKMGVDSFEALKRLGLTKIEFKTYPFMGHSASNEELQDVLAFLRRVLP